MGRALLAATLAAGALLSTATAAETITYGYDSRGRLVRVAKAGGPSNGVVTTYGHDKAHNRRSVKTTGASR